MAVKKHFFSKVILSISTCLIGIPVPLLALTKADLLRREEQVHREFVELQENNNGTSFIYQIMEKPEQIEDELIRWNQALSGFYSCLDSFIIDQQLFFLEESYENAKALVARLEDAGRYQKDVRTMRQMFIEMQASYLKYHDNLGAFATGKDYRRINSYVEYFRIYRKFLRFFNYVEREAKPWNKKLSRVVIRNGIRNPGLIKEVFRPKSRPHGSAPLTELIKREGEMLRDIFEALEMEVDIRGEENIPEQNLYHLGDKEVVNIFAHQHGHGIIDELVKAHIPILHYMVMWAVKIGPIPRFMQQYLERSPSIIPVGAEVDPLTSTMERLDKRISDNIAIHPQGELNIFNEVMPVHKNFAYRYLKTLRENGYQINLIPVSSQYAPVFLYGSLDDMKNYPNGNQIKVGIEKAISPELLDTLLQFESGYEAILHFLRLVWLEKAVSNDVQILGGLRTQSIEDKFRSQIGDFVRADFRGKRAIDWIVNHVLERNS
ncbi:MAG: hypothetical protein HRU09_17770 [Oligoflexales bacterium]|nr:hypothetical protein [Oligoflexales bacterium]